MIAISGSGSKLGFVAAANNSPLSGTGTVYYTDGTTQPFTLGVGNFWYPADRRYAGSRPARAQDLRRNPDRGGPRRSLIWSVIFPSASRAARTQAEAIPFAVDAP